MPENLPFELYEQVRDYIDQAAQDLSPDDRQSFLDYLEADVECRQIICFELCNQ